MRIKYKILLIVLVFFLFLTNIFTEESEKKTEGEQTGYLTGTISIKFNKYWNINILLRSGLGIKCTKVQFLERLLCLVKIVMK